MSSLTQEAAQLWQRVLPEIEATRDAGGEEAVTSAVFFPQAVDEAESFDDVDVPEAPAAVATPPSELLEAVVGSLNHAYADAALQRALDAEALNAALVTENLLLRQVAAQAQLQSRETLAIAARLAQVEDEDEAELVGGVDVAMLVASTVTAALEAEREARKSRPWWKRWGR